MQLRRPFDDVIPTPFNVPPASYLAIAAVLSFPPSFFASVLFFFLKGKWRLSFFVRGDPFRTPSEKTSLFVVISNGP